MHHCGAYGCTRQEPSVASTLLQHAPRAISEELEIAPYRRISRKEACEGMITRQEEPHRQIKAEVTYKTVTAGGCCGGSTGSTCTAPSVPREAPGVGGAGAISGSGI